jgi:NTE family protein
MYCHRYETGKEVLLEEIYASHDRKPRLPSLFSPVEIDGRILVDGVVNNYPIEEV